MRNEKREMRKGKKAELAYLSFVLCLSVFVEAKSIGFNNQQRKEI